MKYIDADKLRALLDEKWRELADKNVKVGGGKWDAEISTYLSVLTLIDSLQQERPEVDLNEEVERFVKECGYGSAATIDFQVAHHFYELARQKYEK